MELTKEESRFLYESNAIEREYSAEAFKDAISAWNFLITREKIGGMAILGTHRALMLRLNPRISGRLRTCDVSVGGYSCPSHFKVPVLLEQWVAEYADADTKKTITEAHVAFEKIHPFEDGNGRVGRIVMNAQRVKAGLPIWIIHEGTEQMEYYGLFE